MKEEYYMDKRVINTRNKIKSGMIQLLKKQKYKDITVKDICAESQVSRATFYLHFKDKEALIFTLQQQIINKAKAKFLSMKPDDRIAFFEYVLKFWRTEGELILLLLGDQSAYELHHDIKQLLQKNIEVRLVPILDTSKLTTKEQYFLLIFMSNAVFGILQDWVQRGLNESPKEVATTIDRILRTVFK